MYGDKVKEVARVYAQATGTHWGYAVTYMPNNGGDLVRFIVSEEAIRESGCAVIPTVKALYSLVTLRKWDNQSGNHPFLRTLFARRLSVTFGAVIPFEAVAALCEVRYAKPYHVYRDRKGTGVITAVVAERGSGITSFQAGTQGRLEVKRRNGDHSALNSPHVVAYTREVTPRGFKYNGSRTFTFNGQEARVTDGEIEFLLNAMVDLR